MEQFGGEQMETNEVVTAKNHRRKILPILLVAFMALAVFSVVWIARAGVGYVDCCLVVGKDCCTHDNPEDDKEVFEFTVTLNPGEGSAASLAGIDHVHGILLDEYGYPVHVDGDVVVPETYKLYDSGGDRCFDLSLQPNQHVVFANPEESGFPSYYYFQVAYESGCTRNNCLLPFSNPKDEDEDTFVGTYTITEKRPDGEKGNFLFSEANIVNSSSWEQIAFANTSPSIKGTTVPARKIRSWTESDFLSIDWTPPVKVTYEKRTSAQPAEKTSSEASEEVKGEPAIEEKIESTTLRYSIESFREALIDGWIPTYFHYVNDPNVVNPIEEAIPAAENEYDAQKGPAPYRFDEAKGRFVPALENPRIVSWDEEAGAQKVTMVDPSEVETFYPDNAIGVDYGISVEEERSEKVRVYGIAWATFTNIKNPIPTRRPGDIVIAKELESGDPDDTDFHFELLISPEYKSTAFALGQDGQEPEYVSGIITDADGNELPVQKYSIVNNTVDFTLKAGQSITFKDVPFLRYEDYQSGPEDAYFIVNEIVYDENGKKHAKGYDFVGVELSGNVTNATGWATEVNDKNGKEIANNLLRIEPSDVVVGETPEVENDGDVNVLDEDESWRDDPEVDNGDAWVDNEEPVFKNPYTGVFGELQVVPDSDEYENPLGFFTPTVTFTNKKSEVVESDTYALTITKQLQGFDFEKFETANVTFNVYRFDSEEQCKKFIEDGDVEGATWINTLGMQLGANGIESTRLEELEPGFYAVEELKATNMRAVRSTRKSVEIKADDPSDKQFVVSFRNIFDDQNAFENSIVNTYKKVIGEDGKITWKRYQNGVPVKD